MTHFGTSAKYLDSLRKSGLRPRETHDLSSLRAVFSTGSPLAPESFDFVYEAIKPDLHLASISGGTDILSCFVLGDPTRPVFRGEIQGPGLGLAVEVRDADGRPAAAGRQGRARLRRAVPGDAARLLERRGRRPLPRRLLRALPRGLVPGRLRRGHADTAASSSTAAPTRRSTPAACASAPPRSTPRSRRCPRCARRSRSARTGTATCGWCSSSRCAPAPCSTTRSSPASRRASAPAPRRGTCRRGSSRSPTSRAPRTGKVSELAVRDVVHGRPVANREALANPEALALFRDHPELRA